MISGKIKPSSIRRRCNGFPAYGRKTEQPWQGNPIRLFLSQQEQLKDIDHTLQRVLEQVEDLKRHRFGRSSERHEVTNGQLSFMETDGQTIFFNEPEAVASVLYRYVLSTVYESSVISQCPLLPLPTYLMLFRALIFRPTVLALMPRRSPISLRVI